MGSVAVSQFIRPLSTMTKSLRIRLLIWQIALLAMVVIAFGWIVFAQWRKNYFADIDTRLTSTASILEGTLRAYAFDGSRPLPSKRAPDGLFGRRKPPANERHIYAGDFPPETFDLPHSLTMRRSVRDAIYFSIFDANDQVISQLGRSLSAPPEPLAAQQVFQFSEGSRRLVMPGPGVTRIVVGYEETAHQKATWAFLSRLSLIGVGILAVGCLGGFWITGRAVAPINHVSQTLQQVTGTNISKRIDPQQVDQEFAHLVQMLNEMLDRLETTIEQQRTFVSNASHELRTPISILGMHSELALSRQRTAEEYRSTLDICLRTSQRLTALTENLLTIARADAGQLAHKVARVDLSQLARESVEFLQPLANQRNIQLDHSGEEAHVSGDGLLLRQLIDNLLTNAITYNHDGGNVFIQVSANDAEVNLEVTDHGPGIEKEHLPFIFDRFYRVSESRASDTGGTGLGLAICQSISNLHDGQLTVHSDASETTFQLTLPAQPSETPALR